MNLERDGRLISRLEQIFLKLVSFYHASRNSDNIPYMQEKQM